MSKSLIIENDYLVTNKPVVFKENFDSDKFKIRAVNYLFAEDIQPHFSVFREKLMRRKMIQKINTDDAIKIFRSNPELHNILNYADERALQTGQIVTPDSGLNFRTFDAIARNENGYTVTPALTDVIDILTAKGLSFSNMMEIMCENNLFDKLWEEDFKKLVTEKIPQWSKTIAEKIRAYNERNILKAELLADIQAATFDAKKVRAYETFWCDANYPYPMDWLKEARAKYAA